jgi:23S rRNA G2069 N7-methylase RlmK/C1962 C5-methylase RlmI
VTCWRAYDRDMPELPLQIDVFEAEEGAARAACVVAFAPRHGGGPAFDAVVVGAAAAVSEVLAIEPARVFTQVRERDRGGEVAADDAASSALELIVREGRARLLLKLGARRDPGLFLDHRTTRRLVAEECAGRSLLNLFAYTGSFSVQAALAGASSTTSVDLSQQTALWAEQNLALNDLTAPAHRVLRADVLAFREESREQWDVVVVDPPSFSRSRRAQRDFDVARDHVWLIGAALRVCKPAGSVWFSTNLRGFQLGDLTQLKDVVVVDVTARTQPPDFQRTQHRAFRIQR